MLRTLDSVNLILMYFTLCTILCVLWSVHLTPVYLILCTSLKGFARKNPSRCFREKQLSGYNSFIAPYANYDFEIDLFLLLKMIYQTKNLG